MKKPAHREYTKYIGKVVSSLSTIPDKNSWETLCKLIVVHSSEKMFFLLLNVPRPHYATLGLTNRPQFSMVYALDLIDYRNEVIK